MKQNSGNKIVLLKRRDQCKDATREEKSPESEHCAQDPPSTFESTSSDRHTKSLQERELAYNEARRRIFGSTTPDYHENPIRIPVKSQRCYRPRPAVSIDSCLIPQHQPPSKLLTTQRPLPLQDDLTSDPNVQACSAHYIRPPSYCPTSVFPLILNPTQYDITWAQPPHPDCFPQRCCPPNHSNLDPTFAPMFEPSQAVPLFQRSQPFMFSPQSQHLRPCAVPLATATFYYDSKNDFFHKNQVQKIQPLLNRSPLHQSLNCPTNSSLSTFLPSSCDVYYPQLGT